MRVNCVDRSCVGVIRSLLLCHARGGILRLKQCDTRIVMLVVIYLLYFGAIVVCTVFVPSKHTDCVRVSELHYCVVIVFFVCCRALTYPYPSIPVT